MAAQSKPIRYPAPLLAAIEAAAERNGRTFSGEVLATLGERYLGMEEEAAPRLRPATAKPRAELPSVMRGSDPALAKASEGTGGVSRARAAMDAAGIEEWDPNAKRVPYQKGSAGAGKAKGRR